MLLLKIKRKLKKVFTDSTFTDFKQESYSQTGEDVIVKFIFDRLGIKAPTYIDIGAHHPFKLSNTALLYKTGSRGVNIEPDPDLFKSFLEYRKEDINVNLGIGDTNAELDFYVISSPTLNTFSKKEAESYQTEGNYSIKEVKKIQVKTVNSVLEEYVNGKFPQFLNLDAEGIDDLIIKSIDYESNFPIVICVESISFSTNGNGIKNSALIEYIVSKGYMVYADTYINTIFVREELWRNK